MYNKGGNIMLIKKSDLARYAIRVVYCHKKEAQSPLISVLGIIDDKGLARDIDKHLYG